MKDYTKTIELLKKKAVKDDEAVEILNRALPINPSNQKTFWKMTRLTYYVWERFAEYNKGNLVIKTDTISKVVNMHEYQRMHNTVPVVKFDAEKWLKNLHKLLGDPRQFPLFKSYNFMQKGTSKPIPQDILDKIIFTKYNT